MSTGAFEGLAVACLQRVQDARQAQLLELGQQFGGGVESIGVHGVCCHGLWVLPLGVWGEVIAVGVTSLLHAADPGAPWRSQELIHCGHANRAATDVRGRHPRLGAGSRAGASPAQRTLEAAQRRIRCRMAVGAAFERLRPSRLCAAAGVKLGGSVCVNTGRSTPMSTKAEVNAAGPSARGCRRTGWPHRVQSAAWHSPPGCRRGLLRGADPHRCSGSS
jgi:hypothetical protein